jgi:hypothetical protein
MQAAGGAEHMQSGAAFNELSRDHTGARDE